MAELGQPPTTCQHVVLEILMAEVSGKKKLSGVRRASQQGFLREVPSQKMICKFQAKEARRKNMKAEDEADPGTREPCNIL